MSAFNFYGNQEKGIPGMKADTTVDVIDSYAAKNSMNPGDVVYRYSANSVAGYTTVAGANKVVGVVVHTHKDYEGTGDYYEAGYNVPVMSFGDVYVAAGDDSIVAGGQAYVSVSGGSATFVSGGEGADSISGMTYMSDASAAGDAVVLRIRK